MIWAVVPLVSTGGRVTRLRRRRRHRCRRRRRRGSVGRSVGVHAGAEMESRQDTWLAPAGQGGVGHVRRVAPVLFDLDGGHGGVGGAAPAGSSVSAWGIVPGPPGPGPPPRSWRAGCPGSLSRRTRGHRVVRGNVAEVQGDVASRRGRGAQGAISQGEARLGLRGRWCSRPASFPGAGCRRPAHPRWQGLRHQAGRPVFRVWSAQRVAEFMHQGGEQIDALGRLGAELFVPGGGGIHKPAVPRGVGVDPELRSRHGGQRAVWQFGWFDGHPWSKARSESAERQPAHRWPLPAAGVPPRRGDRGGPAPGGAGAAALRFAPGIVLSSTIV